VLLREEFSPSNGNWLLEEADSREMGKCFLKEPYLQWNMLLGEASFGEIVSTGNRLPNMLL
jgi:hypothetical protein